MIAAGRRDGAAAVAGALRARRPRDQRQRRPVAAALAQQPAPASTSLACVLPNPNHAPGATRCSEAARSRGRATPTRSPRRSARCRSSRLAVIAGGVVARSAGSRRGSASASRSSSPCSRSAPSSTSPASTRRSRCRGACSATCRSWAWCDRRAASPSWRRWCVAVLLRAGARAPRPPLSRSAAGRSCWPSACSWRSSWCPGRARSTRRRSRRSTQTIAARSAAADPRARAAGRRARRHRLDRRLLGAHAVLPDARTARRSSAATCRASRRGGGWTSGARPS